MTKNVIGRFSGKFWAAVGVVLVAVTLVVQKVYVFSADPAGPKNCPPLNPDDSQPVPPSSIPDPYGTLGWEQKGGVINDASCLDETTVYGIVQIKTEDDIRKALAFARERKLKVSIAGVRHSMGGQAFARGAVVLDMTGFNAMTVHPETKTMTVQSGARWSDIQNKLHPTYAVKSMQSTDLFTVGGSISVNGHGMDHRSGSVGDTVQSLRLMKTDGSVVTLSRTQNKDLFEKVVGGYGLFGIILDAQVEIVDNELYDSERALTTYKAFPELFKNTIEPDPSIKLFYGHLSTSPGSLLDEMILYTYKDSSAPPSEIPPLQEWSGVKLRRLVVNLSKLGPLAMRLKWMSEKYIEPHLENCVKTRNQALGEGEGCLTSRNDAMHDNVAYLKNIIPNDTDILHEYFIPRDQFVPFIDGLRTIVQQDNATLLNASIRVVHAEDNFLTYAPNDAFAVVLYFNQTTDKAGNDKMKALTSQIIDLTNKVGGRFFLPYQLFYTPEQLKASYPQIAAFFRAKKAADPQGLLTNTWYDKYAPAVIGAS